MVLSSAIVCDHDRRIADDRRSSFHMIADDRRPYCDLRSAIKWKPAFKAGFHMIADRRSQIADRKQSQLIADDRRR